MLTDAQRARMRLQIARMTDRRLTSLIRRYEAITGRLKPGSDVADELEATLRMLYAEALVRDSRRGRSSADPR